MTVAYALDRRDHVADLAHLDTQAVGWNVCLGRHTGRLVKLLRAQDRLRLVIGEPLSDQPSADLAPRVIGLARTLLFARLDPDQTVDRLAALTIWPELGEASAPRLSIAVADLFADGVVEVACRYAPSVLRATAGGMLELLPPSLPDKIAGSSRLDSGDHLIAYSASFLGALPPETLSALPNRAQAHSDPCGLWNELAASRASSRDRGTPADLVVLTRSDGRERG